MFSQPVGPVVQSRPSDRTEEDEDCYEEAEPFIPATQSTGESRSVQTAPDLIHLHSLNDIKSVPQI